VHGRADRLHVVVPAEGSIYDSLWDVEVSLAQVERELLEAPALTRLHRVVHAGASALTTAQTYSRLEHVLGVFALAARFAPSDEELRAALAFGGRPSLLRAGRGRLGLDHLDSFARAGRAHGWLRMAAPDLLGELRVVDGAIDGSSAAGEELVHLMVANAGFHAHPLNVGPTALVRRVFRRLAAHRPAVADVVIDAGDEQLWGELLSHDATRDEARRLLASPGMAAVVALDGGGDAPEPLETLTLAPQYVYEPVTAISPAARDRLASVADLPTRFAVGWPEEVAQHAG
jgi:hypothetical protein